MTSLRFAYASVLCALAMTSASGCSDPAGDGPDAASGSDAAVGDAAVVDDCQADPVPPGVVCPGDYQWDRHITGSDFETPKDIVVGPDGAVIVTGLYNNTIDFGTGEDGPSLLASLFIVRYSPDGQYDWHLVVSGTGEVAGQAAAVGANGDITVAGDFRGEVDLGGGVRTGSADFASFVLRVDQDGNYLWDTVLNTTANARATALDGAPDGGVAVAGSFIGDIDFGGGSRQSTGEDAYVVRLDGNGDYQWDHVTTGADKERPHDLAIGSGGQVVVSGSFAQDADFGGGVQTSAGGDDGFVVALDAVGGHRWADTFGGVGHDTAIAVAVTGAGDVRVAGFFRDAVDFGGGVRTPTEGSDGVLLALGDDGQYEWDVAIGVGAGASAYAVEVAATDDVVVGGGFLGSTDFGGGVRNSGSGGMLNSAFAVGYRADGSYRWDRVLGSAGTDFDGLGVGGGVIAVAGRFDGTNDFGSGEVTSASPGYDGFVVVVRE